MNSQQSRYSPYQGLIPFAEKDSDFFFGREKETRLIIANLFASPLTILYGPSGVGKSSILRAGAVHQLNQRTDLVVIIYSDWKDEPLLKLKSLVYAIADEDANIDITLSLGDLLSECSAKLNQRIMIVLDQFEEYFLYHPQEDEFAIQFSKAVIQANSPVSFLISIREDALAKLDRFEGRIPILFDNYLRLDYLDETAARDAIEKPIEKYNQTYLSGKKQILIEPELVIEVLKELKTGQVSIGRTGLGTVEQGNSTTIETPYLQLVMERLWQRELENNSNVLRLQTLFGLGGAAKIVRTHLDSVMRKLSYSQRRLASRILQYLVTPSGPKIALRSGDLASYADSSPPKIQTLLQRLTEHDIRLLRAIQTSGTNEMSYEIFHDVLAAPILDWRARQVRSSRSLWIIFSGITALLVCLYVLGLAFFFASAKNTAPDIFNGVIFCAGGLCMGPIMLGFLIGRGFARAR